MVRTNEKAVVYHNLIDFFSIVTPNSSLDTQISSNNNSGSNHIKGSTIISADSSVASSISLDEDEESPAKVKKKDEHHVSIFLPIRYKL